MPFWEWKLVTLKEYTRLKKRKPNKKELELSLIWKSVYWFGDKSDWYPLWEWHIIDELKWDLREDWEYVIIDALNRNIHQNKEQINVSVKRKIIDIRFDKKKKK